MKQPDPGAVRARNEQMNKELDELIKKGTGDRERYWTKSSLSMTQLASKVAQATKYPRATRGMFKLLAQTSEGRGIYEGELSFQRQNVFKVNWIFLKADPVAGIFLSDGKKRQVFFDGKLSPAMAVTKNFSGVTTDPAQLVARFPNEFPRFLFQGATDGKDPWVPLISAWARGAGGYKAVVQERNITYQNRKYKSFRIKLDRTAEAAKKLGKSTLEVVFDGTFFLPVTVRELREDLRGKSWVIQWAGNYSFNQKFKPTDFQMQGTASRASL